MKLHICIAQINYNPRNIKGHLKKIRDIIVKNREADLVVFPELLLHGHPSLEIPEGMLYRRLKHFYREISDDSDDLYTYVKKINARVIMGELKGRPGKFYNAATYIDKDGTDSYIKTHVHWTEHFTPGSRLKVFSSPFGKVGINICFDAAFTEVWRIPALSGAKIIVNISAVPDTFPVDYMWLRMRSAALNNQVFVIYANRPGQYFSGHSAVFDPRGNVVVHAEKGEAVLNAEIDLREVDSWREEESIYPHRKPLLYRGITRELKKTERKKNGKQIREV